jgi:membrane fusion protein (multidrug efflux system)
MQRKIVLGVAAAVALAAIGYGIHAWVWSLAHVSTDDAYVEGTIAPVSSKVAGHVAAVLVEDNQAVKAGQVIVRIDPRDYQARRDQARAAVAVAEAALRAARSELPLTREVTKAQGEEARAQLEAARAAEAAAQAAVAQSQAFVEARRAAVAALRAEVGGAESTLAQAVREVDRTRRLVADGLVAQRDMDVADTARATAGAALEAAQKRLAQSEREVQQAEAELAARRLAVAQARERIVEARAAADRAEGQRHQVPMKEAEIGRVEAQLNQARADLEFAELQLAHTEIRAPADGIVSKKSVEVGQVVQMGQPLMAVVPLHTVWVVANFKETQLERVRAGQPATVRIDSYPGRVFTGVVESISAGTGSRFSLLPPENATGNWVKVVQRIPVKIRLESRDIGNPHPLRAGMSSVVTIRVK